MTGSKGLSSMQSELEAQTQAWVQASKWTAACHFGFAHPEKLAHIPAGASEEECLPSDLWHHQARCLG